MPINLKVFIQTLQKSQDRHKISFAFEFNNKTPKNFVLRFLVGADLAHPNTIKLNFAKARKKVFIAQGLEEKIIFKKIEV